MGFACGSFLWGVQHSWPLCGYRDLCHLSKKISLCVPIALCFTWALLPFCCHAVDHLGWTMWICVLWRKQGLKMHFLHLAAIRIPRSLLFCSLWPYVLLCVCRLPQGCFFCWCERNDGMIYKSFFYYTAYQQPWRGLSAKCSNAGCSYKKGTKHHRFVDHPENPVNSFQLRNG